MNIKNKLNRTFDFEFGIGYFTLHRTPTTRPIIDSSKFLDSKNIFNNLDYDETNPSKLVIKNKMNNNNYYYHYTICILGVL